MSAAVETNTDDVLVTFTIFDDTSAQSQRRFDDRPWPDLVARVRDAKLYPTKQSCPLIVMAEFGERRSSKNALRHADNVIRVFGAEADYDGGSVSMDHAAKLLQDANIKALLYTSPSHTPERPRWRALLPFGDPALPEKRREYVGRANRVLGGILSDESFVLSQSFYIGRVKDRVYETRETHGRTIDLAADLEPLYPADEKPAGEFDSTTDDELRAVLRGPGPGRRKAMLKLAGRLAARGMSADDIASVLHGLLAQSPDGGGERCAEVSRMAEQNVREFGESRRPTEPNSATTPDPLAHIRVSIVADLNAGPAAIDAATAPEFVLYPGFPVAGANIAGSGGASKTTLVINEKIRIVNGGELYGWPVDLQGPCVLVTAEDGAPYGRYLLQQILVDGVNSGALPERCSQRAKQDIRIIGWPRAKYGPIVYVDELGAFHRADVFDLLLEILKPLRPPYITLDPSVLFSPGERYGNDGDAFLAAMIHDAALELRACVQIVDHVAQNVARNGIVDQYAARGGTAKTDNARLARQLIRLKPEDAEDLRLPPVITKEEIAGGNILQLHWTKSNYAPRPAPVLLRRRRYWIEHIRSLAPDERNTAMTQEREEQLTSDVDVLVSFVRHQLTVGDGIRYTQRALEQERPPLPSGGMMTRQRVRAAVQRAVATGRLQRRELPPAERHGQRKDYLVACNN